MKPKHRKNRIQFKNVASYLVVKIYFFCWIADHWAVAVPLLVPKRRGYGVRWEAGRKSITYTTPEGQKCRDNKLHEAKYLKERMEIEFGLRATQAQEQRGYAGSEQGLPAGKLLDSEGTVELNCEPIDPQLALAPGNFGNHGHTGNRRKHAPVLPGDEAIPGGNSQRTAQPTAGDVLTGWEDERAEFFMAQGHGSLFEEPDGTVSREPMEEADLDSDWAELIPERLADYPDVDSEMTQWQMRF